MAYSEEEKEEINKKVISRAHSILEDALLHSDFESIDDVINYVKSNIQRIKDIREKIIQEKGNVTALQSRQYYIEQKATTYARNTLLADKSLEELEDMRDALLSQKEKEEIEKAVKGSAFNIFEGAAYYSNFESKEDVVNYVESNFDRLDKIKEEIIIKKGKLSDEENRDYHIQKKATKYVLDVLLPDATLEELEEMRDDWQEQLNWNKQAEEHAEEDEDKEL